MSKRPIRRPNAIPTKPSVTVAPRLRTRVGAEVFGTYVLVAGGVGAATIASTFPDATNTLGIGYLGVAFAFGLAVIAAAYAVGHVSGGHFNPAVTIGLTIAGKFPRRDVIAYLGGQLLGAILATTTVLIILANGPAQKLRDVTSSGFASNGYGEHSPGGYNLLAVTVTELVLTAVFVYVILGVTDQNAPTGFAPLAIGLALTLIHLVSIPVSNTSVNPARSIATAIYGGPDALSQVWIFLLAPIAGGIIAGATYRPKRTATA